MPRDHWQKIDRYREFRDWHDPAWHHAQAHPISLYEFMGLSAEGLVEFLGEPPKKRVETAEEIKRKREEVLRSVDSMW